MRLLGFGPADQPVQLVFLHANGFNARTYRAILEPLGRGGRVLAVDQRGHGATTLATVTEDRTTWLDLRDDLLALLERLESRNVVLAGHSMGGTVCLLAAAQAPERARNLVLLDPVVTVDSVPPSGGEAEKCMVDATRRRRATFPSRAAAIEAYRGRGAFRTWREDMLADYVAGGVIDLPDGGVRLACDPAWEASGYAAQAHDSLAAFRRSVCPIHILKAEHESTCRLEGRREKLTASGRIVIETIAGTSHFLPMEQPEVARVAMLEAMKAP